VPGLTQPHNLYLEVPRALHDPSGGSHHSVPFGAPGAQAVVVELDLLGLVYLGEANFHVQCVVGLVRELLDRGDEDGVLSRRVVMVVGLVLLLSLAGRLGDPYVIVLLLQFLCCRCGWRGGCGGNYGGIGLLL
jgi:hypothetical protein